MEKFGNIVGMTENRFKSNAATGIDKNPVQETKISKGQIIDSFKDKINQKGSLSTILIPNEIFLPNGLTYKVATVLAKTDPQLNTNQLRKFFDMIKAVETKYEEKFDEARNDLYRIVPLAAYAVGRNICPIEFYEIIEVCINEEKLQGPKDVKTFIDFFETIVAYSKIIKNEMDKNNKYKK